MDSIFREATPEEKRDFEVLGKKQTAFDVFEKELAKELQKAVKLGKPFAERVARDDFKDSIKDQVQKSVRKNGYLIESEIKIPNIDLAKYSDLKNFEIISENERFDEQLSKRMNKPVYIKLKKYKFKGYSNIYTVMEDPFKTKWI